MGLILSIENATDYTPTLTAITLNGARWRLSQELTVGQSMANHTQVVGWLETTFRFSGTIVLHFSFVMPGPDGADVKITFSGRDLDGRPLVGFDVTAPAFPHTDARRAEVEGETTLHVRIAD